MLHRETWQSWFEFDARTKDTTFLPETKKQGDLIEQTQRLISQLSVPF